MKKLFALEPGMTSHICSLLRKHFFNVNINFIINHICIIIRYATKSIVLLYCIGFGMLLSKNWSRKYCFVFIQTYIIPAIIVPSPNACLRYGRSIIVHLRQCPNIPPENMTGDAFSHWHAIFRVNILAPFGCHAWRKHSTTSFTQQIFDTVIHLTSALATRRRTRTWQLGYTCQGVDRWVLRQIATHTSVTSSLALTIVVHSFLFFLLLLLVALPPGRGNGS